MYIFVIDYMMCIPNYQRGSAMYTGRGTKGSFENVLVVLTSKGSEVRPEISIVYLVVSLSSLKYLLMIFVDLCSGPED